MGHNHISVIISITVSDPFSQGHQHLLERNCRSCSGSLWRVLNALQGLCVRGSDSVLGNAGPILQSISRMELSNGRDQSDNKQSAQIWEAG